MIELTISSLYTLHEVNVMSEVELLALNYLMWMVGKVGYPNADNITDNGVSHSDDCTVTSSKVNLLWDRTIISHHILTQDNGTCVIQVTTEDIYSFIFSGDKFFEPPLVYIHDVYLSKYDDKWEINKIVFKLVEAVIAFAGY